MLIELTKDRYGSLLVKPVNKVTQGKVQVLWGIIGYAGCAGLFMQFESEIEEFLSEVNQRDLGELDRGWPVVKRINNETFEHHLIHQTLSRVRYSPDPVYWNYIESFIKSFGYDPATS